MEIYEYVPQDGIIAVCKAPGFSQALTQFGTRFKNVDSERVVKVNFDASSVAILYNKPVNDD